MDEMNHLPEEQNNEELKEQDITAIEGVKESEKDYFNLSDKKHLKTKTKFKNVNKAEQRKILSRFLLLLQLR